MVILYYIIITVNIHEKMYNLGQGPITESLPKRRYPNDILASNTVFIKCSKFSHIPSVQKNCG